MTVGTVTTTSTPINRRTRTVMLEWTASVDTAAIPDTVITGISGYNLYQATTIPSTPSPTASYDIVIEDTDGVDVMGAALMNRSATLKEQVMPVVGAGVAPRFVLGALTVKFTNNAVNSAKGTLKLYFIL